MSSALGRAARPTAQCLAFWLGAAGCNVESTVGHNDCPTGNPLVTCTEVDCVARDFGPAQRGMISLAVDAQSVYFVSATTVLSKRSMAGATVELVDDLNAINGLAADDRYVYWTQNQRVVRRVPKSGGAAEVVVDVMGHPTSIASSGDQLYVTLTDTNEVVMAPKSGGAPTFLADQALPQSITTDAESVYWVNQGAAGTTTGQLMRAPLGDLTSAQPMLTGLASPIALTVGEDYVYYAVGTQILKIAKTDGTPALVLTNVGELKSMAIVGDTLYLTGAKGLLRGRTDADLSVLDPRGMIGLALGCQGVFSTGWFEPILVRYAP